MSTLLPKKYDIETLIFSFLDKEIFQTPFWKLFKSNFSAIQLNFDDSTYVSAQLFGEHSINNVKLLNSFLVAVIYGTKLQWWKRMPLTVNISENNICFVCGFQTPFSCNTSTGKTYSLWCITIVYISLLYQTVAIKNKLWTREPYIVYKYNPIGTWMRHIF